MAQCGAPQSGPQISDPSRNLPPASDGSRPKRSRTSKGVPEIEIPSYHGIHVAPLQPGHVRINWLEPTRRSDRIRVREHTCDCKVTIYELCHAGGVLFVRRTVRALEGYVIRETERLITVRMEDLWTRLILGQAR